jgi:hypothetical protein
MKAFLVAGEKIVRGVANIGLLCSAVSEIPEIG